ncbi:MAG: glycosyltransferase family 2 protein [Bacteroidales bacterium]|nr:glycosyltransferase family 2 protein [Bacteroidales bacterium]
MLSFIVIGRNEERTLSKCFSSIIEIIDVNNYSDAEIIYVDSNSNDNSINIASQFNISSYIIKGEINAAVARNVGAEKSIGNILIFIDGDMEIMPEFFPLIIDDNKLTYPFVSGQFVNYCYSPVDSSFLYTQPYHSGFINGIKYENATGGLFAVDRKYWVQLGGMRDDFRRSQDLDFGLRMAKLGIPLLRHEAVMANHHTIQYTDRLWDGLLSGSTLYRFYLLRRNLSNKYAIKRFISKDPTVFLLLCCVMGVVFFNPIFIILCYLFLILIISAYHYRKKFSLDKPLYLIVKDVLTISSLLFFYPSKNKKYSVTKCG